MMIGEPFKAQFVIHLDYTNAVSVQVDITAKCQPAFRRYKNSISNHANLTISIPKDHLCTGNKDLGCARSLGHDRNRVVQGVG